jgi:hypothetical protein
MPVMATAPGTQDESAPEDHSDDENDSSQGDDHGRKPKWPATSVPPVLPVWRFGGGTRLLSCSRRLSRMFKVSHRSQHAPQSQECAVRMRRRDLRSREPLPPLRTSVVRCARSLDGPLRLVRTSLCMAAPTQSLERRVPRRCTSLAGRKVRSAMTTTDVPPLGSPGIGGTMGSR